MIRRIVIIDKKVGSPDDVVALTHELNTVCAPLHVAVSVFAQCHDTQDAVLRDAAVVFLHHGNAGWPDFAMKRCSGRHVVLTSTVPDRRELDNVRLTPAPLLLTRPVKGREDWLRLPWPKAIKAWRVGELFPVGIFENDRQWPEDLVAVYLALVAADRGVNVLATLAPTVWGAANSKMLELVSAYGPPEGGWREFDASRPDDNMTRLAAMREVLMRMVRRQVP